MRPLQNLSSQVNGAVSNLRGFMAGLTGANDFAATSSARALMRAIRKRLSVAAAVKRRTFGGEQSRSERSQPGESPRRVTGKLRRSVGTEVVGGVRRVGVARFVGRLLEEGVDTTTQTTPSGRSFNPRRRKAKQARRVLKIERRPFMEAALQEALPRMEQDVVSDLQARDRLARIG